ncbi:hypothetical protein Ndes2437B_g02021 [Nannochloris sp. 'desiccata']
MASLGSLPLQSLKCLQFRHDCQHLGCANPTCPQCALCQRRRCVGNFAPKYLAPCDVLEAKCGAQIYVVIVDTATGALVQSGLDDAFLRLSLVDGRRLASEGEWEEALDRCQLLVNKAGHPLLAHGRSGAYSEESAVVVPMIAGQAMLPDLKVTDSSEALLTGRAPPFRLLARVVQRGGLPFPGVAPVLSEPFVVATARVKGAAKAEIPHIDDNIGKLEGLGVQTQKKLEDITAAAAAANVPNLQIPFNSVSKVGQFKELVEIAERSKPLRETLKQVLRLTKGWDVARDHARRAVHTDVQLRVYHPDGRTDVGLVYRCGAFNVVDINQPAGLLRRRRVEQRADQELVDVIWLETDVSAWPDAVRRIVPRAAAAWWHEGHPGWAFLPLQTSHIPAYGSDGKPTNSMSSYSFTLKSSPPPSGGILGMPGGIGFNAVGLGGGNSADGVGVGGALGAGTSNDPNGLGLAPGMVPQVPSRPMEDMPFPGGVPTSALQPPQQQQQQQQLGNAATGTAGAAGAGPSSGNNPFPFVPPELLASLGVDGNGMGSFAPFSSTGSDGLPNLGGVSGTDQGGPGEDSLSPFEDPAFQHLMQMVASNNPNSGRGPAPRSGGSDGGSKGKRKADASLDTWMAMHKSLDLDLDLPSNLGMDSLPASGSAGSGAGPRTIVGSLLPMLGMSSLDPPNSVLPGGGTSGGGGTSVPFAEFLATVQQQRAQQRAQMESKLGAPAPPSVLATAAAPLSRGGSAAVAPPLSGNGLPPRSGPPVSIESNSQLMPGTTTTTLPDNAPAMMPSTVTMGQLRDMFSKAVRQEIPFAEVENFLQAHGLVDNSNTTHGNGNDRAIVSDAGAPPSGTATMEAIAPAVEQPADAVLVEGFTPGLDQSGLADMRSMEDDLPAYGKAV